MKKVFLATWFALMGIAATAQNESGFGIKAGLNYNRNGDLVYNSGISIPNADVEFLTIVADSDAKVGFHVGVFAKLNLPKIYIKPELLYTRTQSSYEFNDGSIDYDISRIDLPVLFGIKIIGPVSVFAGPALQYILEADLQDLDIQFAGDKFTIGLNAGLAVNLGNIGLDLRYERGSFSQNFSGFIGSTGLFDASITDIRGSIGSRPSQIIFGLSLKL